MFFKSHNKKECTGCGICRVICPQHAVSFKIDKKGFWYPHVDFTYCNNCGLCEKFCSRTIKHYPPTQRRRLDVLYGKHREEAVVLRSSSGGAYTALCQMFLHDDNNYKIYGASLDETCRKVQHICVNNIKQIDKLRKSKYVQSDSRGIYKAVKADLGSGKKVVFSGVPCQVSALKTYLNYEYDNLFCIELLCHGVTAPKVYARNIDYLEKWFRNTIIHVDMRDKTNKGHEILTRYFMRDGKQFGGIGAQGYMEFYKSMTYYRPCCYSCNLRISNPNYVPVGDAVIGDYYDCIKDESVSLIIAKRETNKMNYALLQEYFSFKMVSLKKAMKGNGDLRECKLPKMKDYDMKSVNMISFIFLIIKGKLKRIKMECLKVSQK